MQQKIIWMEFLTTGIKVVILILILNSCKVDFPVKKATYFYKNESGLKMQMVVKNQYFDSTIYLADRDSFMFIVHSLSGEPFEGTRSAGSDSVGIKFENDKCLSFTRFGGNGVFRLPEYENYVNGLEDQDEFTLTFIFDKEWLGKAKDCN